MFLHCIDDRAWQSLLRQDLCAERRVIDPEEPSLDRQSSVDRLAGERSSDLVEPLRIAAAQQLFAEIV